MFIKGKSGNPGGRPKEAKTFSSRAQVYGSKALKVLVDSLDSPNEKYRIMAAEILLNRAYGKPPQEITSPDGSLSTKFDITVKVDNGNLAPQESGNRISEYIKV